MQIFIFILLALGGWEDDSQSLQPRGLLQHHNTAVSVRMKNLFKLLYVGVLFKFQGLKLLIPLLIDYLEKK